MRNDKENSNGYGNFKNGSNSRRETPKKILELSISDSQMITTVLKKCFLSSRIFEMEKLEVSALSSIVSNWRTIVACFSLHPNRMDPKLSNAKDRMFKSS